MKNIVITGANRGIGLALSQQYAEDSVYALCREASNDMVASHIQIIDGCDVRDRLAVEKAVAQLPDRVDILINNAGLLQRVELMDFDESAMMAQWQVNAMGPLRVVHACLSRLVNGSKIALITSRMGSIADNDSGSHYGYRMSKAALNAAGKSLAIDLRDQGISVAIVHPGWVQTAMTGYTGHVSDDVSAAQIKDRIVGLNLSNSGTFWHANGDGLPW